MNSNPYPYGIIHIAVTGEVKFLELVHENGPVTMAVDAGRF